MRARVVAALGLALVLLAACGDDGPSADPADLEGGPWTLTQYVDAQGQPTGVEVDVTAAFDGSTISGNGGCNQYHADYEATGNEISIGPIAATQMACPDPQGSVEGAYLALLATATTYAIDGGSMKMADDAGTTILQFERA